MSIYRKSELIAGIEKGEAMQGDAKDLHLPADGVYSTRALGACVIADARVTSRLHTERQ